MRFAQDPESLHPLNYGNAQALQVLNFVYQSLLSVDAQEKTIQPLLAAQLPQVRLKDSLSYFSFTLRPEARWDDGSPVTAADVAFSLKVLHSPLLDNERWRAQFNFIKDIEFSPGDPSSFTLVCTGYTPEMKLMTGDFFVLPAHTFDPQGLLKNIPYSTIRTRFDSLATTSTFRQYAAKFQSPEIARDTAWVKGSGPYRLKSWKTGQSLALEKKKGWWGDTVTGTAQALKAIPPKITFQIIPDNAAALLALKAGQLELMDDIPLVPFRELKKDQKYQQKFSFHSTPSFDLAYAGINGHSPKLQEKSTRLALAHLFNIPQIITTLQGGYATATVGLVHPEEKAFYNNQLAPVAFDLKRARQLLQQAGWKNKNGAWHRVQDGQPQKLELSILYRAGNSSFENLAVLFKQNAQAIGIPVSIQALESSQLGERIQNREYDVFLRTLSGNPFSYNLIPLLHTANATDGGSNATNFGTPKTDRLLEAIATEEDALKKGTLLKELQVKMQQQSNWVFLYFLQNKMAISKKVAVPVVSSLKPGYDLAKFTFPQ